MIPFLAESAVRQAAETLLNTHGMLGSVPVDVERLVELKLGLEIVPIPGLRERFGIDGMLSQDLARISVDERVMQNITPRYRFTLAHELGHYSLHSGPIRAHLEVPSDKPLMLWETLSDADYRRAEIQANKFASSLLMPSANIQNTFVLIEEMLSKRDTSFDKLGDYMKMNVLRSQTETFGVSVDALRIRLIGEGLIGNFDNPDKAWQ
jgi:hypothetical protein